jgi:sugar lactone lactonase YvrE
MHLFMYALKHAVNPHAIPMIDLSSLVHHGTRLVRPECVLAHSSGIVFASDWTGNGGVAAVSPNGSVDRILVTDSSEPLRPNGIALEPDGTFLLAHLGNNDGGIFRLHADGRTDPVVTELAGEAIPPTNFVVRDLAKRLWITVSTRKSPRSLDYRPNASSGMIIVSDEKGTRIAADGLGYANECAISPDQRYLYVNETFGRRVTRFEITENGTLVRREVIASFDTGTFPDGLCFDQEGGIWITSIISNRVIRIDLSGRQHMVLEDCNRAHVADIEQAFRENRMVRPHLDVNPSGVLRNISSLAFGGPHLRTAYLGCLLGDSIMTFASPVAGHSPIHWDYDLGSIRNILGK